MRNMKSEIAVRPIILHDEERIRARLRQHTLPDGLQPHRGAREEGRDGEDDDEAAPLRLPEDEHDRAQAEGRRQAEARGGPDGGPEEMLDRLKLTTPCVLHQDDCPNQTRLAALSLPL